MRKRLFIIFMLVCGIIISLIVLSYSPIKDEVILEAGEVINIDAFKKKDNQELKWSSDITKIDIHQVGEYEVTILVDEKEYSSLCKSTLPSSIAADRVIILNVDPGS